MITRHNLLDSYLIPMILLASIMLGGVTGYFFASAVPYLKPIGEIFLNLIFTTIVPLIFFNISTAIARTSSTGKLGRIFSSMTVVFLFTSIVAAIFAILIVTYFPLSLGIDLKIDTFEKPISDSFLNQIAGIFSVSDFSKLFSHEHMLALIVFSILVGLATSQTKNNKADVFFNFLQSGEEIFARVFSLIMFCAPIGFFAWFAVLTNELGPVIMQSYIRIAIIYYIFACAYFFFVYSGYAFIAGKKKGIFLFWKNIFIPAVTSIATCSSVASIPVNLIATKAMRVSPVIVETAIPLGSIIHKDGSVIGGIFKIAFVFGLFHMKFAGITTLMTALGVSLLVGTVMGAIPSGGMLGELLILSIYGFPPSALIAMAAISIIIDPMATMLNVTGNSVSSMMIARLVDGKKWLVRQWNK